MEAFIETLVESEYGVIIVGVLLLFAILVAIYDKNSQK